MTLLVDTPTRTATITSTALDSSLAAAHDTLPKLGHHDLVREQQVTLDTPRRRYSLAARLLFVVMDVMYGRKRTLSKFKVLEIVARVPYQTWETVTYKQISKSSRRTGLARRLYDRVLEFRAQQDNEQWHLLILEELVATTGAKEGRFRFRLMPRLIAFGYWHFSWLLYVIRPAWSHRLNADFEDHAEHEYAQLVAQNPQFETTPHRSMFAADYGQFESLADLFRQIGHDERMHKQESEAKLTEPRLH